MKNIIKNLNRNDDTFYLEVEEGKQIKLGKDTKRVIWFDDTIITEMKSGTYQTFNKETMRFKNVSHKIMVDETTTYADISNPDDIKVYAASAIDVDTSNVLDEDMSATTDAVDVVNDEDPAVKLAKNLVSMMFGKCHDEDFSENEVPLYNMNGHRIKREDVSTDDWTTRVVTIGR